VDGLQAHGARRCVRLGIPPTRTRTPSMTEQTPLPECSPSRANGGSAPTGTWPCQGAGHRPRHHCHPGSGGAWTATFGRRVHNRFAREGIRGRWHRDLFGGPRCAQRGRGHMTTRRAALPRPGGHGAVRGGPTTLLGAALGHRRRGSAWVGVLHGRGPFVLHLGGPGPARRSPRPVVFYGTFSGDEDFLRRSGLPSRATSASTTSSSRRDRRP